MYSGECCKNTHQGASRTLLTLMHYVMYHLLAEFGDSSPDF